MFFLVSAKAVSLFFTALLPMIHQADYTVKPPPPTELAASRTGFVFDAAAVTDVPLSL